MGEIFRDQNGFLDEPHTGQKPLELEQDKLIYQVVEIYRGNFHNV